MAGTIYSRFFWQDWASDPKLFQCSAGAQAFWMRCLCLAAQSTTLGHVLIGSKKPSDEDLSRIMGFPVEDVRKYRAEIIQNEVCDVIRGGILVSRRMVKDAKHRESSVKGGKNRWNQVSETPAETPITSRSSGEPPLTINQSPESTSQNPPPSPKGESPSLERSKDAQRMLRLSKALRLDLTTDWNKYARTIRQLGEFERNGVDIDNDLIPCIEQMREDGRIPEDVASLAYFEKPVAMYRQAREVAEQVRIEIQRQAQAKAANKTQQEWIAAAILWLDKGVWDEGELGPHPLADGCLAPTTIAEKARKGWAHQGHHPLYVVDLDSGAWVNWGTAKDPDYRYAIRGGYVPPAAQPPTADNVVPFAKAN